MVGWAPGISHEAERRSVIKSLVVADDQVVALTLVDVGCWAQRGSRPSWCRPREVVGEILSLTEAPGLKLPVLGGEVRRRGGRGAGARRLCGLGSWVEVWVGGPFKSATKWL